MSGPKKGTMIRGTFLSFYSSVAGKQASIESDDTVIQNSDVLNLIHIEQLSRRRRQDVRSHRTCRYISRRNCTERRMWTKSAYVARRMNPRSVVTVQICKRDDQKSKCLLCRKKVPQYCYARSCIDGNQVAWQMAVEIFPSLPHRGTQV